MMTKLFLPIMLTVLMLIALLQQLLADEMPHSMMVEETSELVNEEFTQLLANVAIYPMNSSPKLTTESDLFSSTLPNKNSTPAASGSLNKHQVVSVPSENKKEAPSFTTASAVDSSSLTAHTASLELDEPIRLKAIRIALHNQLDESPSSSYKNLQKILDEHDITPKLALLVQKWAAAMSNKERTLLLNEIKSLPAVGCDTNAVGQEARTLFLKHVQEAVSLLDPADTIKNTHGAKLSMLDLANSDLHKKSYEEFNLIEGLEIPIDFFKKTSQSVLQLASLIIIDEEELTSLQQRNILGSEKELRTNQLKTLLQDAKNAIEQYAHSQIRENTYLASAPPIDDEVLPFYIKAFSAELRSLKAHHYYWREQPGRPKYYQAEATCLDEAQKALGKAEKVEWYEDILAVSTFLDIARNYQQKIGYEFALLDALAEGNQELEGFRELTLSIFGCGIKAKEFLAARLLDQQLFKTARRIDIAKKGILQAGNAMTLSIQATEAYIEGNSNEATFLKKAAEALNSSQDDRRKTATSAPFFQKIAQESLVHLENASSYFKRSAAICSETKSDCSDRANGFAVAGEYLLCASKKLRQINFALDSTKNNNLINAAKNNVAASFHYAQSAEIFSKNNANLDICHSHICAAQCLDQAADNYDEYTKSSIDERKVRSVIAQYEKSADHYAQSIVFLNQGRKNESILLRNAASNFSESARKMKEAIIAKNRKQFEQAEAANARAAEAQRNGENEIEKFEQLMKDKREPVEPKSGDGSEKTDPSSTVGVDSI